MVYIIGKAGKPLMPTNRLGKVRHLLKDGLAKVAQRTPFTIQLLYDSDEYTQPITLGAMKRSRLLLKVGLPRALAPIGAALRV